MMVAGFITFYWTAAGAVLVLEGPPLAGAVLVLEGPPLAGAVLVLEGPPLVGRHGAGTSFSRMSHLGSVKNV